MTPAGVAGLEFRPEVGVINNLVAELRANQGVRAFVVLIHQGGQQNAPFPLGYQDSDRCDNFTGDIIPIVNGLSPQVDVVVSAHTHQPYICRINGQARDERCLVRPADHRHRPPHRPPDEGHRQARPRTTSSSRETSQATRHETAIINKYDALSGPIANRIVGSQTADMTRTTNSAGESSLGDVIADAQLASTSPEDFGGAVVAFMNPGGIRADLVCSSPAARPPRRPSPTTSSSPCSHSTTS